MAIPPPKKPDLGMRYGVIVTEESLKRLEVALAEIKAAERAVDRNRVIS